MKADNQASAPTGGAATFIAAATEALGGPVRYRDALSNPARYARYCYGATPAARRQEAESISRMLRRGLRKRMPSAPPTVCAPRPGVHCQRRGRGPQRRPGTRRTRTASRTGPAGSDDGPGEPELAEAVLA